MRRVILVRPTSAIRLELTFDDGAAGAVDLSHLAGRGVFHLWLEPGGFEAVRIGDEGELVWGDAVDLCPDALYLKMTGKTPASLFPALEGIKVHA